MLKLHNKLVARSTFVRECDLADVLRAMDKDADGYIETQLIRQLLVESMGFDPFQGGRIGDKDPVDLQGFKGILENLHRCCPSWNVIGKVMAYAQPRIAIQQSETTQTRKALLVGINYLGSSAELGGCINDVRNEMQLLVEVFGFLPENILLLTEDQQDPARMPTCDNIRKGLHWLLDDAVAGDVRFFAYSGHGSQMAVAASPGQGAGDIEEDGLNECICPVDCMSEPWPARVILDDELNDMFHDNLRDGVYCLCVYDCCHSGTMEDLAYTLQAPQAAVPSRTSGQQARAIDVKSRFLEPPPAVKNTITSALGMLQGSQARQRSLASGTNAHVPDVPKLLWVISGCQDSQTSADATIGSRRQGAMTWALTTTLKKAGYRISYQDLIAGMRATLAGKYEQIPALSSTSENNFHKLYLGGPISCPAPEPRTSTAGAPPRFSYSPPARVSAQGARGLTASSSRNSLAADDRDCMADKLRRLTSQMSALECSLNDHPDDKSELESQIEQLQQQLADLTHRVSLGQNIAAAVAVPDLDYDPDLDDPGPAVGAKGTRAMEPSAASTALAGIACKSAPKPKPTPAPSIPAPTGPTLGATSNGHHPLARAASTAEEAKARAAICGEWVSEKGKCRILEDRMTNRLSYEEDLDDVVRLQGWLIRQGKEDLCWQATLYLLEDGVDPWYGPSYGEEPDTVGDIHFRLSSGGGPPTLETSIREDGSEEWADPTIFTRRS